MCAQTFENTMEIFFLILLLIVSSVSLSQALAHNWDDELFAAGDHDHF